MSAGEAMEARLRARYQDASVCVLHLHGNPLSPDGRAALLFP